MNNNTKASFKRKLLRVPLVLLIGSVLGITQMYSQNTMVVKEKGIHSFFALKNIRKVTFPAGNLAVQLTNGNSSTSALSNLQYLCFGDVPTEGRTLENNGTLKYSLFPNPVDGVLQVAIEGTKANKVQFEIVNLQGKVLHKQSATIQSGKIVLPLSTSYLTVGLYLLRIQNGANHETIKFYKK
jgi:hypothetical protein